MLLAQAAIALLTAWSHLSLLLCFCKTKLHAKDLSLQPCKSFNLIHDGSFSKSPIYFLPGQTLETQTQPDLNRVSNSMSCSKLQC